MLLNFVVQNAMSMERFPLSTLYDRIEADILAPGSLKILTKVMGRFVHQIIEAYLSEEVYSTWQSIPLYQEEVPVLGKLDYLLHFLNEKSKHEKKHEARNFCFDSPEATNHARK